ncbi:myosin heavy chain, skeletal muscle, adult-like [Papaver somniferum]|uniref:myosin heavy chain, skeletal muscle, adult-like n=1 Tax=Papaver somniferum TaxID=3469 RepID=UPI000E6F776B|nr:myosin heavy chain, skeletal muscle, adult-like [Papaver somniferum]
MDASEAFTLLEDTRVENLNLSTQNDSYVTENEILNEKVETLFSQVDRLSTDYARIEELNHHLHIENENLRIELQRVNNSLTTSRNLHSSSLSLNKHLEEDKERVIKKKDKSESDLRKARNEVTGLKEKIQCLKNKVEFLLAHSDGPHHQRPTKPSTQAKRTDLRKSKGSVVIRIDEDFSEIGLGKGSDISCPEPYFQLEVANIEVSRLDHLYSDIQQTLNSTILQMEESEEHFKNQILHVSRERDDLRNEVSLLKTDAEGLNTDLDEMEKDAAKVAKMSRKNTQSHLVKLFNEFCDGHGIPRAILDLEVFSDDEKRGDEQRGDEGSVSNNEVNDFDEDVEDEKTEGEVSKGASVSPNSSRQPSVLVSQSQGAGAGEAGVVARGAETSEAGEDLPKIEVTDGVPLQQQSLFSLPHLILACYHVTV